MYTTIFVKKGTKAIHMDAYPGLQKKRLFFVENKTLRGRMKDFIGTIRIWHSNYNLLLTRPNGVRNKRKPQSLLIPFII